MHPAPSVPRNISPHRSSAFFTNSSRITANIEVGNFKAAYLPYQSHKLHKLRETAEMADTTPVPSSSPSAGSSTPSSAAEQARIRKERREAKIRAGGSARLNKITGLGGGVPKGETTHPFNFSSSIVARSIINRLIQKLHNNLNLQHTQTPTKSTSPNTITNHKPPGAPKMHPPNPPSPTTNSVK